MAIINKPSFTEHQLAERWGMSIRTLQNWRRKGIGIGYLKLNGAIRYPYEIVEKYEMENMKNVGSEQKQA